MLKIKVLWICNVPIPKVAKDMGLNAPNICGWLTGFAEELEKIDEIDLNIAFPVLGLSKMKIGNVGKIHYYAFNQPKMLGVLPVENQLHISKKMEDHITEIIKDVKPDILHSFGTEYPHSTVASRLFNSPERTIVNIQGLTSYYWMHYNTGIPYKELKRWTISNIIRGNLIVQAHRMKKRGIFEVETLRHAGHVIGRTDWDEACTNEINPKLKYHFCNESLREAFYKGKWEYQKCDKHSIFMSQAAYPIKGLHFMLRALPEILKKYPDTHLYVAGNDLTNCNSLYGKLKNSSYAKYIKYLIDSENLKKNVTFTGPLTETQMKEQFLKTNIFVSPSTIENSPNSLGEAMLLGVPCVVSDVGGVKNLIKHEEEGFVYQADAPYMLAYYVKKLFENTEKAEEMGKRAQYHAKITHDRQKNIKRLIQIYYEIMDEQEE